MAMEAVADTSCSTMKALPEGIMFEIFLNLPLESISKFKCVSKLWQSILSDPNFMQCKFKILFNESKPWAIFSNHVIPNLNTPSYIKIPSKLIHTQLVSSCTDLSGYDGFSFSFLNESHGFNKQDHKLHVLASSNGLVLFAVIDYSSECIRYFVCNPITKDFVALPPPPTYGSGKLVCALDCETDSSASAVASVITFKVFRMQSSYDKKSDFPVEIYLSDLDQWRTYQVSYLLPEDFPERFYYRTKSNVITHDGELYWLEENNNNGIIICNLEIDDYECDSDECFIFKVPMQREEYGSSVCLGVSDGSVCYGHISGNTLRTWELMMDDNRPVWVSRHEVQIELPNFVPTKISLIAFSPMDRDVVILDCGKKILPYDVIKGESEALQRICVPPGSKNTFEIQHGNSTFTMIPSLTRISKARR